MDAKTLADIRKLFEAESPKIFQYLPVLMDEVGMLLRVKEKLLAEVERLQAENEHLKVSSHE